MINKTISLLLFAYCLITTPPGLASETISDAAKTVADYVHDTTPETTVMCYNNTDIHVVTFFAEFYDEPGTPFRQTKKVAPEESVKLITSRYKTLKRLTATINDTTLSKFHQLPRALCKLPERTPTTPTDYATYSCTVDLDEHGLPRIHAKKIAAL